MASNIEILSRAWRTVSITPPRKAGGNKCSEAAGTVVLQLGKGNRGQVFNTSEKLDVKGYMTKKQKEMPEEDEE